MNSEICVRNKYTKLKRKRNKKSVCSVYELNMEMVEELKWKLM